MAVTLDRPYCTLEDVQKEMHLTDSTEADWQRQCINQASRLIEETTHRDFLFHNHAATAYTVRRGDVIGCEIFLPWPIVTLTEIDQRGADDTENIVDSSDYGFSSGGSIITGAAPFERLAYKDTVKVKGTFGYALDGTNPTTAPPPTIPAEIRRACALIAAAMTSENRREMVALDGARVEVLDHNVPEQAKKMLARYTRFVH